MNQTILQLLCKCAHYSQAYRTRYNTESLHESPLHHHHFVVFPELTTHLQPSDLANPIHPVQ